MSLIYNENKELTLKCGCKTISHQLCFSYDPEDIKAGYDDVYVYLNSDINSSFFNRLWASIKYIFKSEPIPFYEIVLLKSDMKNLYNYVSEYNESAK